MSSSKSTDYIHSLHNLPPESIVDVMSSLDYKAINAFCNSSSKYLQYCNTEDIWRSAVKKQFPYAYGVIKEMKNNTSENYAKIPSTALWKYYFVLLDSYSTEYSDYPDFVSYVKYGVVGNSESIFYEALNSGNMDIIYFLASDDKFEPIINNDIFFRVEDMQAEEFDIEKISDMIIFILGIPKFRNMFDLNNTLLSMIELRLDEVVDYMIKNIFTPAQINIFINNNRSILDDDIIDYLGGFVY